MQYVKILANSHPEAIKKLRETYGPEAIIFSETEVKPDSFISRALGKKQYLIEAAIREKNLASTGMRAKLDNLESILDRQAHVELPITKRLTDGIKALPLKKEPVDGRYSEKIVKSIDDSKMVNEKMSKDMQIDGARFLSNLQKTDLFKERPAVNSHVSNSDGIEIQKIREDISVIREFIAAQSAQDKGQIHEVEFKELFEHLCNQQFSEKWTLEFVNQLKSQIPQNEWKLKKRLYAKARDLLASRILVNPNLGTKRVVVLLGSTGVGKTTTLAKLMARLKLKEKQSVSVLTLDNFRIAATEQLKIYADILDIPFSACKDAASFHASIENINSDIILVDSTGTSQNNRDFLLNARQYFESLEHEIEKHLVMAATSKPEDAASIIDKFDLLKIDKIILTKLDETESIGNFIELSIKWHKPFSFITTGQGVPEDYEEADKKNLAEKVLGKWVEGMTWEGNA